MIPPICQEAKKHLSMAERLAFVRMKKQGMTVEQIREQKIAPQMAAFNKQLEETKARIDAKVKKIEQLQGLAERARDFDFLAAGKKQFEVLEAKAERLRAEMKKGEVMLEEVQKRCSMAAAHEQALNEKLQQLKNTLNKAGLVVPFRGLMNGIAKGASAWAAQQGQRH